MNRFSEMESMWDWENIVSFGSKPASPSPEGSSAGSAEPLIGLKLGKRTYFENTPMQTPSYTALKKNKPKNAPICCQVDGCNEDLSRAKDYHKKHRVCSRHSKFPKVVVGGQERRFCQQCSRFHSLSEFDEKKRSCRRRLSDHNARRRKPQPESVQFYGTPPNPVWDTLSRFPHEINVQNRGNEFMANKYSTSEVFNFNPGSKRSLASPSSLEEDADRALSLLSSNPWGSVSSHNLMHQSESNIAHSMIHANAEGVPLSSAEFWLSGQQSIHPNIHSLAASASSSFHEFQLFKTPYETDFYSSLLN